MERKRKGVRLISWMVMLDVVEEWCVEKDEVEEKVVVLLVVGLRRTWRWCGGENDVAGLVGFKRGKWWRRMML